MNSDTLSRRKFLISVIIGFVILLGLMIGVGSWANYTPEIYISEVCAHNSTVKRDPLGRYSDYVVISNDSDFAVNLEGYGLSNDRKSLRLYVFPKVMLPAHDRLTVWAAVSDEIFSQYADESVLYTGFKLGDNETIYLTNSSLRECDTVFVPISDKDVIFVRDENKGELIATQSEDENVIAKDAAIPQFSAESGFYDYPFDLFIDSSEGEILYTLHGENPYTDGILYQNPIHIEDITSEKNRYASLENISLEEVYVPQNSVDKANIVRAVIRFADGTYSRESYATYFVGEDKKEKYGHNYLLSLIVNPKDLFSEEDGIYVLGGMWNTIGKKGEDSENFSTYSALTNYNMRGRGWQRSADMTLWDDKGNLVYEENGRVGMHGNWSRSMNQKSFNLLANDGARLFDGLFEDSGSNFVIRTGGTDDARLTNFRDAFAEKASDNLLIAAQRSVCVQVFIDGEYWGCYNLQDKLDESYIAGRYYLDENNVNLVKNFIPMSGLEEDIKQYTKMIEFVDGCDCSNPKDYDKFCTLFDIDSVIDYYCCEIYFNNADAFYNNIAFWRSREVGHGKYEDGKWRFALCDLDSTTGFMVWGPDTDTFVDGHWGEDPFEERFFGKLVKSEQFREEFCKRFLELAENDFSYKTLGPLVDEFEKTYSNPMVLCNRRYADSEYSLNEYLENTGILRDYLNKRGDYICDYLIQHLGN